MVAGALSSSLGWVPIVTQPVTPGGRFDPMCRPQSAVGAMTQISVGTSLREERVVAAGATTAGRQMWPAVTAAMIAGWAGLALFFVTGPVASDDFTYLSLGGLGTSSPDQVGHDLPRFGFWYPLTLVGQAFGDGRATFVVMPFVSALAATGFTAALARRWVGPAAAPTALLSLGMVPVFLVFSTISVPDTMGAMLLTGVLWLAAPALLERESSSVLLRCVLGGFVAGFSVCAKETVILICPALAAFVLLFRTRRGWAWARLAAIALGATVGLGLDFAVLWRLTGDPLYQLRAMAESCRGYGSPLPDDSWQSMLRYVTEYFRMLAQPAGSFGVWGLLYLVAVVHGLLRPRDWTRLLLCCLFVIGGYVSVGTIDLREYFPVYHQSRYLITLLPVGALLTAHLLVSANATGLAVRRGVMAALGIAAAVSVVQANAAAGRSYDAATFRAGELLFARRDIPGLRDIPLVASADAARRLAPAAERFLGSPIRVVENPPPETAEEWRRRYPGHRVIVTMRDRMCKESSAGRGALPPASLQALMHFEQVASCAPPAYRINEFLNRLGLVELATNDAARIEVYYVPPLTEPLSR